MFGDIIQPTHLLLILVVALLVLGPKRLPEVGRSLGRGIMSFRQGIQGVQEEARGVFGDTFDEPSQPPADSAVSTVPEPIAPPTAEPVAASVASPAPAAARVVAEPDPADYAD